MALANTRSRGSERFFLDALDSDDYPSRLLGLAILREFGGPEQAPAIVARALELAERIYAPDPAALVADPVPTISRLELLLAFLKTTIKLDPGAGEALFLRAAEPVALSRSRSVELKIAQAFYEARWQSLYGLGYARSGDAQTVIEAALDDPDARIRAVALRSMGVIGASERQQRLQRLLDDEAAEVRWMAARVLGRLGAKEAVDALISRLDDRHARVRLEAALALGYLEAAAALPKLGQLAAGDPAARVSEAAAFAVSLIE